MGLMLPMHQPPLPMQNSPTPVLQRSVGSLVALEVQSRSGVCLQAAVGGRMRLFISGGAPLPTYAGTFMAVAMNVPVLQVGRD